MGQEKPSKEGRQWSEDSCNEQPFSRSRASRVLRGGEVDARLDRQPGTEVLCRGSLIIMK